MAHSECAQSLSGNRKNGRVSVLLFPHFVAHLGVAGSQVGHRIVVTLRTGDFDLPDLHSCAIKEERLAVLRHLADREAQNHETAHGVISDDRGG